MATKWDFLQPWCATLGPYLSLQATPASERDGVEIMVHVGRFVGTAREVYDQRLLQLHEALAVVVGALQATSSTERTDILRMCSSPQFQADLQRVKIIANVRFRLEFEVAPRGDHPHALRILQELLHAPSRSSTRVEGALSKVLALAAKTPGGVGGFFISLRPPAKHVSTVTSSFITAPSRSETLDYYRELETLVGILQKPSPQWIKVSSLELDLTELETPPEALASIGKIVAASVRIERLALQLAYTWDFFDHAKFILATTRENYAAAMESLPQLVNCRHVKLDDRVLFGEMPPSFMSAFRRAFLSSTGWPDHWRSKKLTLRGLPFDEQFNKPAQYTHHVDSGLQRLAVYLAGADVAAFMQYLTVFGSCLEEVEIHITDRRQNIISLPHIADACPSLRELWIEGAIVDGIEKIISPKMTKIVAWKSLKLTSVTLPDGHDVVAFAQALQRPNAGIAKSLTELALVTEVPLPREVVDEFERALDINKRLERVTLGRLEDPSECKLLKFHQECLQINCYAFLSVLTPTCKTETSASGQIDTWNLRHIMDLADVSPRREVILL